MKILKTFLAAIMLSAIFALIAGIAPADSQEVGPVRFLWEINFTTLIVLVGAAFGWWFTVVRQGDKVRVHAATIAKLELELASKVEAEALKKVQDEIEALNIKAAKIEIEHAALKDEVYRDYLNGSAIREIKNEIREDVAGTEERVMNAIRDLSERFDRFAEKN